MDAGRLRGVEHYISVVEEWIDSLEDVVEDESLLARAGSALSACHALWA